MFKSVVYLFLILLFPFSSVNKPAVVKAEDLVKRFSNSSDTTYVINFWATWCAPCIKELTYFEKLNYSYINKKVKIILVSMDFLSDYDSKLVPFVKKKSIQSEILLLDETKPNEFIDRINSKWNGSIPATMIVNNSRKYNQFFEREITYSFLEDKIKLLLSD